MGVEILGWLSMVCLV